MREPQRVETESEIAVRRPGSLLEDRFAAEIMCAPVEWRAGLTSLPPISTQKERRRGGNPQQRHR